MKAIVSLLDFLIAVFALVLIDQTPWFFGHWLTLLFIMVLCIVNIIAIATENPKTPKPY